MSFFTCAYAKYIGNSDARVSVNDIIGEEAGSVFMRYADACTICVSA